MLRLLKTQNSADHPARYLYGTLLAHIRQPGFYQNFEVPDTFNGRFDLLLAHVFLVMNAAPEAKDFNQELFDIMFADMDQTIRERGIGDMGVPKHMKRMMKAFNGRMHAYHDSFADEAALKETLKRNIYGTVDVSPASLEKMTRYMKAAAEMLERHTSALLDGRAELPKSEDF